MQGGEGERKVSHVRLGARITLLGTRSNDQTHYYVAGETDGRRDKSNKDGTVASVVERPKLLDDVHLNTKRTAGSMGEKKT